MVFEGEFPLREDLKHRALRFTVQAASVDFNNGPINVWVYRERPGEAPYRIRVTGHASQDTCRKASTALIDFTRKRNIVAGYFSYGIADLYPAGAREDFGREATSLEQFLRSLSQEAPQEVSVLELFGSGLEDAFVTPQAQMPDIHAGRRTSYFGEQLLLEGPAFVPVRTWDAKHGVQPLVFEVGLSDLGLDARSMEMLAGNTDSAPLVEKIELLRQSLQRMDSLMEARKAPETFRDQLWSYSLVPRYAAEGPRGNVAADIQRIQNVNADIRRILEKYRVLDAVMSTIALLSGTPLPAEFIDASKQDVQQLQHHLRTNEDCIQRLRQRLRCDPFLYKDQQVSNAYIHVEFQPPESSDEALQRLFDKLEQLPESTLREARNQVEDELKEALGLLQEFRKQRGPEDMKAARSRVVDGLLRGWPVPVSDLDEARIVNAALDQKVPKFWEKWLPRLQARRGPDLREPGKAAGRLSRPNVFFRVRELKPGRYEVRPEYVVGGGYAEVWDARLGLVTIEGPFEPPQGAAIRHAAEQEGVEP
jgi:hypothetical protein